MLAIHVHKLLAAVAPAQITGKRQKDTCIFVPTWSDITEEAPLPQSEADPLTGLAFLDFARGGAQESREIFKPGERWARLDSPCCAYKSRFSGHAI
jgi:hypothetical protein